MMYEELVQRLRSQCRGYGKECEDCNADGNCRSQMENEAADAIEELQNQLREEKVDNVNLTGWLAEEYAKHLWIPVTEQLPEFGARVICKCRANIYEVLTWTVDGWEHDPQHVYMSGFVTHWMPLPKPPKEET